MRTRLRAVVVDPDVVFVASLMKADAPALVASFQCDFILQAEDDGTQNMRANLRELKVLACPFIRNKECKAITTVRSHNHGGATTGHVYLRLFYFLQVDAFNHVFPSEAPHLRDLTPLFFKY